ncbi:UNVERIFIED_CONTAM: cytochrome [Sesamum radiatum]|uniref:Cytochrome n=1 Tax=Sesamum radiatum TaxID=300843 RepID=A0AAW2T402_SESRA
MILQFSSVEILVSFSLLILMFLKLVNRIQTKHSALHLPPGPRKIPFIGNMHLLVRPLPHRALRGLAMKYGPLMHLQLGEVSTVIVSSPDVAEEVMKTQDTIFASRPEILAAKVMSCGCPGIVFSPYGDYWRQLRKICTTELLSSKSVQSFRSLREEEFLDLCRWIASKAGSPINLTEKVYSSAYSLTAKAAFGKKTKDQETFISIIRVATKLAAGFEISDVYPSIKLLPLISGMKSKLKSLQQQADRILETIINEHIVGNSGKTDMKEKHDLVDVLLKCQEDKSILPLTSAQIKSVLLDIFSAGSETSATTVDWAMSDMLRNPSALKKAQDEVRNVFEGTNVVDEAHFNELKFLKSVIKETLRLHPPAPLLLPRESNESCKINGYDIPIKTRVIVNAWAIGRDAKYWEQPECFQPERFLDSSVDYKGNSFKYIPFGAGRRICPGMSFGIANVELPLAMFLYHFDWNLPQGMKHQEMDMTEAFGVTVRRKHDLFVTPVLRSPFPV